MPVIEVSSNTIEAIARGVAYVIQSYRDNTTASVLMPQAWRCLQCSNTIAIYSCFRCKGTEFVPIAPSLLQATQEERPTQPKPTTKNNLVWMPQAWKCCHCLTKFQVHNCPDCGGTTAALTAPLPASNDTSGSLAFEYGKWQAKPGQSLKQEQQPTYKCQNCGITTSANDVGKNAAGEPYCSSCRHPYDSYECPKCGRHAPPKIIYDSQGRAVCPSCGWRFSAKVPEQPAVAHRPITCRKCSASYEASLGGCPSCCTEQEMPEKQPETNADATQVDERCDQPTSAANAPE